MIALVALAVVSSVQSSAADFFPIEPGMKWQYEVTGDGPGTYSQEVGQPVDLGGKLVTPLLIKMGAAVSQTTFYDITSNGVYVLGHDPKAMLVKPQPVFQIAEKEARWEFQGPSPYEDDKVAGMSMTGQSKIVGMKKVLGENRICLEVKTDTMIGLTKSTATTYKQVAVYAKGVGLVEMDQTVQLGKKVQNSKVKLIKLEGAKAVGG